MSLYQTNYALFANNKVCPAFVVTGALPTNNTSFEDTNIASGRIGFYKYDSATDLRWENTTSALALTDKFFIGYNRNGTLLKTPEYLASNFRKSKTAYTAPVKQQEGIGYNGTSGSLASTMSSITADDQYIIKLHNTTKQTFPWRGYTFNEVAVSGDTAFSIMARFARKMSDDANVQYASRGKRFVRAILKTSLTGSAITNTATVAAVKGATTLTTSAAHGVGVADFIYLGGDLYQAVTGTTGSTLVLDRPYTGATATIANASAVDLGATAPTYLQLGLVLEAEDATDTFTVILGESGVDRLYGSTISRVQNAAVGVGEFAEVRAMEERSLSVFGYNWQNETPYTKYPNPNFLSASTAFYTQYVLTPTEEVMRKSKLSTPIFIYVAQADSSTVSTLLDTVLTNIPSA